MVLCAVWHGVCVRVLVCVLWCSVLCCGMWCTCMCGVVWYVCVVYVVHMYVILCGVCVCV